MKKIITILCLCPVFVFSQDKVVEQKLINSANVTELLQNDKQVDVQSLTKEKLEGFKMHEDNFNKTISIKSKMHPWGEKIELYVLVEDGKASLRIKTFYEGSRWVFMNKIKIVVDGNNFSYDIKDQVKKEVLSGGKVIERSDMWVDSDIAIILGAISKSKNSANFRFSGSEGFSDKKISKNEILKIKHVLDFYNSI